MKSTVLLLTIVLITIAVNSQAQTVQKTNYLLNLHVAKGQNVKKANRLADSLTIEEKLMMMPFGNDLYYKINAPFKLAAKKDLKAAAILYRTINTVVKNWYVNKYNIDYFEYDWRHAELQHRLTHQTHVRKWNGLFSLLINKR